MTPELQALVGIGVISAIAATVLAWIGFRWMVDGSPMITPPRPPKEPPHP